MKNKSLLPKMYFFSLIFVLLISITSYSQPNWSWSNTGANHIVLIQSTAIVTINGATLSNGDYIGVFYDSLGTLGCAGYVIWNGSTNAVTAWGNSSSSSNEDGFAIGELFKWKIWSSSLNQEFDAVVTYMGSPMPNQGTYTPNGMSGIATAMSTTSIYPSITSPTCFGLTDGSIDLSISFGSAPYTFLWSSGETTQNLSNLSAGIYSVSVTDALGTVVSLTMEVVQPNLLEANILVNEDSAFMCMGHAQVFPTGGTGPYSYLWNTIPAQSTQVAELCPGLYNVTIVDSNNCFTNYEVIVDANSLNVIDTVFTFLDTCAVTFLPDTAYISNLLYSNGIMIIEWTIIINSNPIIMSTSYPGITTPGLYYVGLVINCPTKDIPLITFVSIYDIPAEVFSITNVESTTFSCSIHPNPIKDNLNLYIENAKSSQFKIEIYNTIGNKIIETDIEQTGNRLNSISIPDLPSGMYFVKVYNSFKQSTIVKFLK